MQKHTKIYMEYFGYQIAEDVSCEFCNYPAVDIHHIHGRGIGKDIISNLMALCRTCHNRAHNELVSKSELQIIHDKFLKQWTQ